MHCSRGKHLTGTKPSHFPHLCGEEATEMSQGLTQAPSCGMCCYVPHRRTPSDTAPWPFAPTAFPSRPVSCLGLGVQRSLGVASHPAASRLMRKGRTQSPGNPRQWLWVSGPPGLFPGLSGAGTPLLCLCSPQWLWLFLHLSGAFWLAGLWPLPFCFILSFSIRS